MVPKHAESWCAALPTYVDDYIKHKRKPVTLCPYSCWTQFVHLLLTKYVPKTLVREKRQLLLPMKHNRTAPSHDIQINDYRPWNTVERLLPMPYRSMTAGYKTKNTNTPKMCEMWAAAQRSWNRETCVITVIEKHCKIVCVRACVCVCARARARVCVCESNLLLSGKMI